jgi:hypothetical protein
VVRRWMHGSTRTASARKDGLVVPGAPGEKGPFRATDGENGGRNDTDDLASLRRGIWGKGQPSEEGIATRAGSRSDRLTMVGPARFGYEVDDECRIKCNPDGTISIFVVAPGRPGRVASLDG